MPDLHARLLVEIERREGVARAAIGVQQTFGHYDDADGWIEMLRFGHNEGAGTDATLRFGERSTPGVVLAYLAALRGVVELHRNAGGGCHECEYDWPCATVLVVAEGIGVTP